MQPGVAMIRLTPRELQVVHLVVEGATNAQIAVTLGITVRTVQHHVYNAMSKTGTSSRTALAVFALRSGLVPLQPNLGRLHVSISDHCQDGRHGTNS